ncbi:MAG: autotransporter domain-containing protein, partial [Halothiobacillus sp.]|nr:autotransporter domain-containing protein [Halothiobacillus sp.]
TVQLDSTSQVAGKIVSSSGTTNGGDTLLLTGGGGGTIGADQLVGFGTYAANSGSWTLTGTGDASQNWALSGGATGLIGTTQSLVGNINMGNGSYVNFLNNPGGTYYGTLNGAGDVVINGGSVTFAGQNTYSGSTLISNGATLKLTGNGVLGDNTYVGMTGTSPVLDFSASNLALNSDTQNLKDLASASGSNAKVHLGSGRINITGAGGQVFNGTIDGTGAALFTVSGGQWGLGGTVTTGLPFVIQGGAQVNIYGDGTITNGVSVNGMLSLGNTNQGFTTRFLQGSGMVALSDKTLTLTDGGSSTYYGQVTGGAGSMLHLTGGTQIFTRDVGFQYFSGQTLIDPGANLLLNLAATMPKSDVTVNGTLTVAGPGPSTAEVRTLNGDGVVNITGSRALQIDDQGGVFSGTITNATNTTGNLVIASSASQTLSGVNTYNGTTTLRGASTLKLSGAGSIADSTDVVLNALSVLDLSGTTAGTTIQQVHGTGNIQLGDQTLTLSNPNANNMAFDGQILGGAGGLHLQNGSLKLSLPGTYHGDTVIDPSATLAFSGQGSLADSTVVVNGTLDGTATNLVNASNNYVVVGGLSGDGVVNLAQPNSLQINNAQNSVFSGQLNFGSGTPGQLGFLVMQGGTQTFDSAISLPIAALIQQNATLKFGSNGSLSLPAQGSLYNDGTLDFSASSATQTTGTISGQGAMILGSGGLSLTGNNSEYTGVISGSGGINLTTGTLAFDGANTYSGNTVVATGASLLLNNQGSLANSQVKNDGVFDLSAATINPTVAGVSGSGALKLGSNTLHLANAQGVFDGAVSGSGTLSMDGGSWIYNTTAAQASGFTGATNITGGQMMVGDEQHSNAFLPGDVAVQSGATLRGHGTIGGNVQNDGTVFPGGSVGILTVNGNYTQGANGVLTAQVLPSTNPVAGVDYDQLHVLGQATLDGALDVVVDSGQYTVGTQYDLVKADGGVSGQFAQVAYNPAFAAYITPTVQYSANTASLRLLPTAAPTPTPGLAYTTANAAVAQPWITQHSLLSVGDTLADAPTHDRISGRHVWLRALKGQGGANAASVDQNGIVLGATTDMSDHWSAGVAFAQTRTQTQTRYQSVQGRGLGLYALGEFNQGPWRIDTSVGGGRLTQDGTRYLHPTGLVASGDTHGWYGSAALTARYHHALGKAAFIEPYAGAAYVHSHMKAFAESGAGVLNLDYAALNNNLGRLKAGLKGGLNLLTAKGIDVKPWVSVGVNAYVGDTDARQDLTLGVLDQTLSAQGASRTALATGAGVTVQSPGNRWHTTLAYEGQHSHDSHFNSVQLKVSYRW